MPHTTTLPSPAQTLYRQRLAGARADAERLQRRERRVGTLRLYVFVIGIALAWAAFDKDALPPAIVALPIGAFAALLVHHGRVITERETAQRLVAYYSHGMARIEGTWSALGERGQRFADTAHAYTSDLDIFGQGSLFQLLCTARSAAGLATLAGWLSGPADPAEIGERQRAVEELRPDVERRERLALVGDTEATEFDPDHLVSWSKRPTSAALIGMRVVAATLVAATITTFFLQGLGVVSPEIFLGALAVQGVFGLRRRAANNDVVLSLELAAAELASLAHLLREIEDGEFRSPKLAQLRQSLAADDSSASARIRQLHRLIQLLDARRNMIFAPLSVFFLWTSQTCMAIEAWRARNGPELPQWLRAVGEYESLCALSGFAYERVDAAFPEVVDGPPRFEAQALRHPLMTEERCVANDIALNDENALLLISGSNMSGKSTLLRTVGTNAVLAQMGAPVCGDSLRMSPLQVGTSMRTQDSLLDGTSAFYAEIKRLKQIVDMAGSHRPLLFMLDEVLHGTNSHDRRLGAEAVARTLLERGAIGLVTTHDLSLAEIAEHLAPRARNVHFADRLIDDEMVFDYRMHDGPVRGSNALGLMRAIGLDV